MEYTTIPNINKSLSRIVLGTMSLSRDRLAESFQLLDDVFDLGVNVFDTAAVYPNDGEAVLYQWVCKRNLREQVTLLTKGAHHNCWRSRVTPFDILSDVHDSLAKAPIGYIDIFMLHRDDPQSPVGPIVEVLNRLVDEKKIRSFGCSNWTRARFEEANDYARAHHLRGFSSISPHFSLAEQVSDPWGGGCVTLTGESAASDRKAYSQQETPIFAYSTLGRGFFSGQFHADDMEKAGAVLDDAACRGYLCPQNFQRLARVEQLARRLNVSVPQLALAWVLRQDLNVFALVGARSGAEMKENLHALDIHLNHEQLLWLDLKKEPIEKGGSNHWSKNP